MYLLSTYNIRNAKKFSNNYFTTILTVLYKILLHDYFDICIVNPGKNKFITEVNAMFFCTWFAPENV